MARNQQLNQKMKDERREKILEHALVLFADKGLAATKITDIARACEMSQGLVYHYYSSKEEIFTALIQQAIGQMEAGVHKLEALDLLPHEKIKLALQTLCDGFEQHDHSGDYHLLIAIAAASSAIPEEVKQVLDKRMTMYDQIADLFRQGQRQGTIKNYDPDEMALVFWTTVKGLAMHKAALGKKFKAPNVDILLDMFIKKEEK